MVSTLGSGRVESLADLLRAFNHQHGVEVAYKAFYNRLARIGFATFMRGMLARLIDQLRTREIGLRLSVGARDVDVLLQFLVEAIVLSVAGGIIGIGVGFSGAYVVSHVMQWSAPVTSAAVLLAFGCATAIGVFFGYYPARKAAALNPSTRCDTNDGNR